MRTLLRGALLAVVLLPVFGQAALDRAGLVDLERQLWQIRTNFHMYGLMDGDRAYRQALAGNVAAVDAALDALEGSADGEAGQQLVKDLRDQWQGFDADPQREPARFDRVPAAMVERLNAVDEAAAGEYDDVRALIAELQRLTAGYTAIVADRAGLPGEAGDEDAFRADLAAFEKELTRVRRVHQGQAGVKAALEEARLKWDFVRGSLVKFDADAVPFLVYRYTNRTSANLDGAIAPADQ